MDEFDYSKPIEGQKRIPIEKHWRKHTMAYVNVNSGDVSVYCLARHNIVRKTHISYSMDDLFKCEQMVVIPASMSVYIVVTLQYVVNFIYDKVGCNEFLFMLSK